MKNLLCNLGFAVLCVVCFLISIAVGFRLGTFMITSKAYKAWNVRWNDNVGTIIRDIDSNPEQQTGYDLYIPANIDRNRDHSLIVYVHGGGFTSGDKGDGEMKCKYYASRGYICASVNYTLTDGKHDSNYNLMYQQILEAVQSIKDYTEKLDINISGMATCGDSAGGYLALLYGYRAKEASPIPVKLVMQMTGPATFEPSAWDITETDDIVESIGRLSGKQLTVEMINTEEYRNIVKEISPALMVDANTIPTVMAYGPKDKIVRPDLKYKLIDALETHNVDYTFIEFPNSGHGMLSDPDRMEEFVNVCNIYLEKYLQ